MPPQEDDAAENVRMIRDSTRAVVAADGDLSRIRAQRFQRSGFDPAIFATMAEMGWLTLRLPEQAAGLGLGMAGQIDHGHDGITAFGAELHSILLRLKVLKTKALLRYSSPPDRDLGKTNSLGRI